MLTLTRRGWSFVLGTLAVWAGWRVIGLRDLWYLVALLGALVAISLVVTLLVTLVTRYEVRLVADQTTPAVGDLVAITAEVHSRPVARLQIDVLWQLPGQTFSMPLGRDRALASTIGWIADHRGHHTIGISGLRLGGPLGLTRRKVRVHALTDVLVLPRLLDSPADLLQEGGSGIRGNDHSGTSSARGSSGAPGGSVRSYRTGDPSREISWKQSARHGELLVNVHEHNDQPERSLLLVTEHNAYTSDLEFERAVSAAATLAVHWLHAGYRVRLSIDDETYRMSTVSDAMHVLAVAQLSERNTPLSEDAITPGVDAVVTGVPSRRLADLLARVPHAGMLVVTSSAGAAPHPPEWEHLPVLAVSDETHHSVRRDTRDD